MKLDEIHLSLLENTFIYLNPKMKGGLSRRGTKDEVAELQTWLNDNGYSAGKADGIYGPKTANAVRKFQKDAKLKVDGDAGAKTIRSMMHWKSAKPLDKKTVDKDQPVKKPKEKKPLAASFDKEKEILNIIAQPESNGKYDAIYPNRKRSKILRMSLSQLFRDMTRRKRFYGGTASGRYQYILSTLKDLVNQIGLDPDSTYFDEDTQDQIALFHLKKYHQLDKFLDGQITSEKFLKRLSKTWAGLPDPSTNMSYYQGVGNNKSNVDAEDVIAKLDQIQTV